MVAHNQEKPHTTPYYSLIFISLLYFKTNEPCKTGAFCIFNLPDFSSRFRGRFLWRPCCHLIRGGPGPPACARPPCWPCCGPGWPPGSQDRTPAPAHQNQNNCLQVVNLSDLQLPMSYSSPFILYLRVLIPITAELLCITILIRSDHPYFNHIFYTNDIRQPALTNELSSPDELYYFLSPISCHFLK